MENSKDTHVNTILNKLKNNKIISLLIVTGIIIISVGHLTDAIKKIETFFLNEVPEATSSLPGKEKHVLPKADETAVPREKTVYEIILVLPSRMSGAKILVDGERATILEQTHTVARIQVQSKKTSYKITAIKGDYFCTKERQVSKNNIKLYLCD